VTLTLLDRLLYEEIGSAFGLGLGVFTVLLVMNQLFQLARLVVENGVAVQIALELMAYKIPSLVAFSVPMGTLLATVLAISRLSEHNEIAALRVSGVGLPRIAVPVVLAGLAAALGTLAFSEGVVGPSDDRYRDVFQHFVHHGPELRPVERVFFQSPTPTGDALYYAQRYDPGTRTLEDVTIVYLTAGQPVRIIQAHEAAYVSQNDWIFRSGNVYLLSGESMVVTKFAIMGLRLPRSPQDLTLPPKKPAEMTLRELGSEIVTLHREGKDTWAYIGQLHAKLAGAASSVVFALIALPLSLRPHRSGPSIGFGLSILVLVAYYLVAIPTQLASDARLLSPVLAAWVPNLVIGGAGVALLARASR
jgi:lipopolysaccharide export system permease protein